MKVSLARLTLVAWLAWLIFLGIMVWLSCRRVLHPNFLCMAIPLAVQWVSTVAVLGGGIWRAIRGPRRCNAVAWTLFGVLPILWMAAYTEYLMVFAAGRNHRLNLLTTYAEPVASLVAEPYLRMHYPYRYEGERFVMWTDCARVRRSPDGGDGRPHPGLGRSLRPAAMRQGVLGARARVGSWRTWRLGMGTRKQIVDACPRGRQTDSY